MNFLIILLSLETHDIQIICQPLEIMTQKEAEARGILFEELPPLPSDEEGACFHAKLNPETQEIYYIPKE